MEGHHDGTLKHSPGRIGLQTRQPMRVDKGLAFAMMGSSHMYVCILYLHDHSQRPAQGRRLFSRPAYELHDHFAETHARGSFGQGGRILDFPYPSICRALAMT